MAHGVIRWRGHELARIEPTASGAARPLAPARELSVLAEPDRPAEAARFANAASTVAQRLRDRAATATGAASEVLGATAQLAQDRAWLGSAENAIKTGKTAVRATADADARRAASCASCGSTRKRTSIISEKFASGASTSSSVSGRGPAKVPAP